MTTKQLKNFYVVTFKSGNVAPWSIARLRGDSIRNYLEGIGKNASDQEEWALAKKYGARVMKVNITFEPAAAPNNSFSIKNF